MAGAGATAPYWVPLLIGGISAVGRGLSGGAEGKLGGYTGKGPGAPGLGDIQGTLLGDQQNRINQIAGIYGARAQQPISLAGSEVQPVRRLGGGSLPFDLGPTAMDPALTRPGLISRESAFAPPPMPRFGQGRPELMSALELLGVTQDQTGNLISGGGGGGGGEDTDLGPQFGLGRGETPSGVGGGPELLGSETPVGPYPRFGAGGIDTGGFEGMGDYRGPGPSSTWGFLGSQYRPDPPPARAFVGPPKGPPGMGGYPPVMWR